MRLEQLAQLSNTRFVRGNSHFDSHDPVSGAVMLGHQTAVASYPTRAMNSPSAFALLQVEDTLTALRKLATNYRRLMPRSSARSIAPIRPPGKAEGNQNCHNFLNLGTRWEPCA